MICHYCQRPIKPGTEAKTLTGEFRHPMGCPSGPMKRERSVASDTQNVRVGGD